jgi:hypothetical protein
LQYHKIKTSIFSQISTPHEGDLVFKLNHMNNVVLSAVTNYQSKDIAPWINSLRKVYPGDVVVIDFGTPPETVKFLQSKDVQVLQAGLNGRHIVVERFIAMYEFLTTTGYDKALATDIKDVIFQSDPFEKIGDEKIVIASENILYKDETWGNNNLKVSYPHMYERQKDLPIYNAGVIAGSADYLQDLFLHIYHLSLIGGDSQPDQAALNILSGTYPFWRSIRFMNEYDAWSVNLGTSLADNVRDKYKDLLLEEPSRIASNSVVENAQGQEFAIVHQWDRVSKLKSILLEKFGKVN